MQAKWNKDCKTNEEKEKRKTELQNGKAALDVLHSLLEENIKEVQKNRLDEEKIDAGFQTRQIYYNAKEKALRDVQNIIKT